MSHPRPRSGTASMDVIRAAAVALCSGSSDSTQKFISTGDLHKKRRHHHPPLSSLVRGARMRGGRGRIVSYLRRRRGAANALRRDGRAAEGADLAGAARISEADERSSDLAAAIVACRDIREEMGFRPPCAAVAMLLLFRTKGID